MTIKQEKKAGDMLINLRTLLMTVSTLAAVLGLTLAIVGWAVSLFVDSKVSQSTNTLLNEMSQMRSALEGRFVSFSSSTEHRLLYLEDRSKAGWDLKHEYEAQAEMANKLHEVGVDIDAVNPYQIKKRLEK